MEATCASVGIAAARVAPFATAQACSCCELLEGAGRAHVNAHALVWEELSEGGDQVAFMRA